MSVRKPTTEDRLERSRDVSPYDLLLAALPVPLFAGTVGAVIAGVDPNYGAGLGSLLSAALLVYGLFYAAPVPVEGAEEGATGGGHAAADD